MVSGSHLSRNMKLQIKVTMQKTILFFVVCWTHSSLLLSLHSLLLTSLQWLHTESTCTTTSTGCAYTAAGQDPQANPATCKAGNEACNNNFSNKDTCEKCQFTATGGTCSVKTSNPTETKEDFGSCLKFSGLIGLLSLLF